MASTPTLEKLKKSEGDVEERRREPGFTPEHDAPPKDTRAQPPLWVGLLFLASLVGPLAVLAAWFAGLPFWLSMVVFYGALSVGILLVLAWSATRD